MAEIMMAFAPLVFLIVYALKTRKMADAMILAALLAMVLLHRQHFLTGAIDALYGALSNSSYQFVLCITIGFGGMITLFQESGALMGFRDLLRRSWWTSPTWTRAARPRRVQHYHHQGHAALCRRRCGWVPAVRDTGVREPAGRFRREAPLHILYGALTWRAAGDML